MRSREKLFGWGDSGGAVPVRLKIVKGGEVFLYEEIMPDKTYWAQSLEREGVRMYAAVRLVERLELSPGNYYIELETLEDVEAFRNVEAYVGFSCFNSKH
ncbi:DUF5625 family protein [Pseudomonas sp. Au-Pse12]|uniref:DUF5625 family protein n=1 Tax=Pseudomonas sp. Au-Pse12 TaxID=2906459 RepID=UPI001E323D43|nr:DUF5625 family protein [Pseudomonas sp. Au-Pse12]MCE4052357.1 DUF5625 family protein [Pseudomonas sp. Au-Pse12]